MFTDQCILTSPAAGIRSAVDLCKAAVADLISAVLGKCDFLRDVLSDINKQLLDQKQATARGTYKFSLIPETAMMRSKVQAAIWSMNTAVLGMGASGMVVVALAHWM